MGDIKEEKKNNYIIWLAVIVFVVIASLIIVFFTSNHTEYISSDSSAESISSLSCSTNNMDKSFFDISKASNATQEIKATFSDNKIHTIMYTLKADYSDKEVARVTEASFHAHYDKYMEEHGLNTGAISNDFTLADSVIRVKLYAEKKYFNATTAQLFMLDSDSYSNISLQDYYENKGFNCNYKD